MRGGTSSSDGGTSGDDGDTSGDEGDMRGMRGTCVATSTNYLEELSLREIAIGIRKTNKRFQPILADFGHHEMGKLILDIATQS